MKELPDNFYSPSRQSSAVEKIDRLKRELVRDLYSGEGPFSHAVRDVRARWGIQAQKKVPSKDDRGTWLPVEQEPAGKWSRDHMAFIDRWNDALRPLKEGFVP